MHHEIGISQDILKKALELAGQKGLARITKLKVVIGEFYLPNEGQILHSFGHVSKGTLAEGAKLELKVSPIRGKCSSCGAELKDAALKCGNCGKSEIEIVSGKELLVEIVE